MAASDAKPLPLKNATFRLTFEGRKNDGTLNTTGTGADTELSKDGGTFADATNEATELATNSGVYYIDLTAAEMNFDTVAVKTIWTNVGAIPSVIILTPAESNDIPVEAASLGTQAKADVNAEVTGVVGSYDPSSAPWLARLKRIVGLQA